VLALSLVAAPALAQNVESLTYTGNGTSQTLTAPTLVAAGATVHMVLIQCSSHMAIRSVEMSTTVSIDGASIANGVTAFGVGTVDVGSSTQVNGNVQSCRAVFLTGNLLAGWGTYSGDGTAAQVTSTAAGEFTMVVPQNGQAAVHLSRGHSTGTLFETGNPSADLTASPSGFVQVAGTLNQAGAMYFIATLFDRSQVLTGSYTGDGTDNRFIGLGGPPEVVLTWVAGTPLWRLHAEAGDTTWALSGGGSATNQIQSLLPLGFQVGSDSPVNEAGKVIEYVAISAFAPLDGGPLPGDGGTSDGGSSDAGMPTDVHPGVAHHYQVGCGCRVASPGWLLPLLALTARRRRSTPRAARARPGPAAPSAASSAHRPSRAAESA
jgi:hypothetical protein